MTGHRIDENKIVLVRTFSAGVHFGEYWTRDGREVVLHNARRIWSWQGANTLNEVAEDGCAEGSRISKPVSEIVILEAIEILIVSDKAYRRMCDLGWSS